MDRVTDFRQDDLLAVIMAGGKGERLYPLTAERAKPAVPFAGIYRLIDFTLNNAVNSGLRRIIVLTQYKSLSLERHLRSGWSFLSRTLGDFIEVIPPQQRVSTFWYRGTADSVYQNLFYISRVNPKWVIVLSGDHIYRMDYIKMLRNHVASKADVSVAAIEVDAEEASQYGIICVDGEDRVTGFQEKPEEGAATVPGNDDKCLASMGVYIFNYDCMATELEEDAAKDSSHDFGKDVIPDMLGKGRRLYTYKFCGIPNYRISEDGPPSLRTPYWRDVGTIDAYYEANMDICSVSPELNLYDADWPLRTAQIQAPPAKTVFRQKYPGGRLGEALDSIVSPGCIISGGSVVSSVIGPRTHVHSRAQVRDSVLFRGVQVGRGARVRHAIIDSDMEVPAGMRIGYDREKDKKLFYVTGSGIVVVGRGALPSVPRPVLFD